MQDKLFHYLTNHMLVYIVQNKRCIRLEYKFCFKIIVTKKELSFSEIICFSITPVILIQTPVLNGFGEVFDADLFTLRQVGNGA